MIIEILVFFALGTALAVLAGLIPGLHPNTVFILLLSLSWILEGYSVYPMLTLVVSIAVGNTIVNFIPSIFLGAPEPDNCLSVLPGHRFLMKGQGYEALFLTVMGGICVLVLTTLALPFLLWFIPMLYTNIHEYVHILLLVVLALLVYQEKGKKKAYSILMFLTSGTAGVLLLSTFSGDAILFPSLSGMFGLSILTVSITQRTSLPVQKMGRRPEWKWLKGTLAGWLAGMFVGIMPGIGSAQAGVLASRTLKGKERDFLVALGGINTSNIVFTFIALHALGKIRSGAAKAVSAIIPKITLNEIYFILLIALLSCFISSLITLRLGKTLLKFVERVNYRRINLTVLVTLLFLIAFFSGIQGITIAALCTVLGLACTGMGVKKMYMMGFLMAPTILHFSGFSVFALIFLGL